MKDDKKKLYFLIASVIQIIIAVYTILNIQQILIGTYNLIFDFLNMYPQEIKNQLLLLIRKIITGRNLLLGANIYLIINLVILYVSARFDISSKKKLLIILSVLALLLSSSTIGMLLLIINIILLGCIKVNRRSKEKINSKKGIPTLSDVNVTNKDIVLGSIFILIYLTQGWWGLLVPNGAFYVVFVDIVMFILAIFVFYKTLKRDFKLFKDNFKLYIKYLLPKIGFMYLIFGIAMIIVSVIVGDIGNVNQESLENLPLLYLAPIAIIYVPVVEEVVFRGLLNRLYKNKKLFIVLSGLFFGFLHTIYEPTILGSIMNAIPYALMGSYLAYIYTKTNNIFTTMTLHMVKNLIAIIFIICSVAS